MQVAAQELTEQHGPEKLFIAQLDVQFSPESYGGQTALRTDDPSAHAVPQLHVPGVLQY